MCNQHKSPKPYASVNILKKIFKGAPAGDFWDEIDIWDVGVAHKKYRNTAAGIQLSRCETHREGLLS